MADGTPLTHAERGRLGGRPVSQCATNRYGATLSSVHIARLEVMAEKATGRDRDHLTAAIECIRVLTAKNRRLGGQVGGAMKRKVLSYRGLVLSGPPEAIAEDIAELAASQTVTVYRMPRKRVRVTTAAEIPPAAEIHRIGTYDVRCDYRQVVDDVREALAV